MQSSLPLLLVLTFFGSVAGLIAGEEAGAYTFYCSVNATGCWEWKENLL